MTDKSTSRTQALAKRRKEAGWIRLNDWLPPEAAARLKELEDTHAISRSEVLTRLLSATPEK